MSITDLFVVSFSLRRFYSQFGFLAATVLLLAVMLSPAVAETEKIPVL